MLPEQTAKAAVDVNTAVMMPIHWGAFTLSLHSWADPIQRVTEAAQKLNMPMVAPKTGEIIFLEHLDTTPEPWWENGSL
jgi:L-ascorbate metabolism protein UlaG (beta-lactamase superfamily)